MLKNALFGGVNAAVLTAMNADLSIDLDRMAAHCRWLLANGCNGLAVLGTTGEANSLGIQERIALLEGLVGRGIPASKMLPGTGTTALTDTVLLTKAAESLGCRGALLLPPFYYKNPSDDGLLAYFNEVAQRVGGSISLYLYNFPQQSAIPFGVEFISRLLKANPGKYRGIKDSSGNYANGSGICRELRQRRVRGLCRRRYAVEAVVGKGFRRLHHRRIERKLRDWRSGLRGLATPAGAAAHEVLAATRKAVISVPLIPGLKALVARNTGDTRWNNIRPPHLPLTGAQQASLFSGVRCVRTDLAQGRLIAGFRSVRQSAAERLGRIQSLGGGLADREVEFIADLQVHPEPWSGVEHLAQKQRGLTGDAAGTV
jgi:4-hydroxy-tetrahydrodipicolinate synthase